MSIRHTTDTKNRAHFTAFDASDPAPAGINIEDLRRRMRLMKETGNSKMPVHLCVIEKLLEAWEMLNGKPEDLRRTFGE